MKMLLNYLLCIRMQSIIRKDHKITKYVCFPGRCSTYVSLTQWGRQTHICVTKLSHHWFILWLVAWSPSHYLTQCWNIVNWTLSNKLQWNPNRNSYIFIHKNAFENVICEMASSLFRRQCVNTILSFMCHRNHTIWLDFENILIITNRQMLVLTHWGRDNWTPFRRRHFQMHFLEWKYINFDQNFTEVCSWGSN